MAKATVRKVSNSAPESKKLDTSHALASGKSGKLITSHDVMSLACPQSENVAISLEGHTLVMRFDLTDVIQDNYDGKRLKSRTIASAHGCAGTEGTPLEWTGTLYVKGKNVDDFDKLLASLP